jgi:hypothetical protein
MNRIYTTAYIGNQLMIERQDGHSIRAKWDVLWKIKNEVAGYGTTMIEVYPAIDEVVNDINRRHLFAVNPDKLIEMHAWLGR